jgi:biotin transporter BioY
MRKFFAMMRYSKKLLILTICIAVDICLLLGLCVFDLIQFIQISKNAVLLSPAFIPLNIVLISLAGLNIVAIIVSIVLKKIKEKSHEVE